MCAQSKLDELQLQIAELADKVQDLEVAKAALASENSALQEAAAARPEYFRNALVATSTSTTKDGVRTLRRTVSPASNYFQIAGGGGVSEYFRPNARFTTTANSAKDGLSL